MKALVWNIGQGVMWEGAGLVGGGNSKGLVL